jgi:hypothetical protein
MAAIQNVHDVLVVYPGLADLAVLTREQETAGQVTVAYVVPSSPGLDLASTWPNCISMPARVARQCGPGRHHGGRCDPLDLRGNGRAALNPRP